MITMFVGRLIDIQVVRAETLNADSLGKRSVALPVYGSRGDILDSTGSVLAGTMMRYNVTLSPRNAKEFTRTTDGKKITVTVAQAAAEVAALTGQTGDEIVGIIASALADNPESDYAFVAKKMSVDVFRAVDKLNIPWIYFERSPSRVYPNGAVAGNLVGFVSGEGKAQAGLELGENSCLASTDGEETYERGADGVRLPESTVTTKLARDGGDIVTTIDSDLQWFVQDTLAEQAQKTGAEWGNVIVQEVKTGKLVAVADYPSVDPNNVNGTTNPEDRGSRAFSASFEPGSTFKALTSASVLDAGVAQVGTQIVAPYRYLPGNGANVTDSSAHADWRVNLVGVMEHSSNTGMSKFGELLTGEQRYNYMTKFGVGAATEVGFPAEDSGILHPWQEWDNQTQYTTMFGQGLTTTALQIASIYQTIANDGVRMPVQLVAGCRALDGTMTDVPDATGDPVISPTAAGQTTEVLEMVYKNSWVHNMWSVPGYRVAAKTGTAQMPDGEGGYTKGYLVSVSGYAPADDAQYVVSVSLANPVNMNSSAASAPIFQKVMSQVLKKNRVVPSGSVAPELSGTW
jgi:cell division protein FtsI (penicillin-binding protein 3)